MVPRRAKNELAKYQFLCVKYAKYLKPNGSYFSRIIGAKEKVN